MGLYLPGDEFDDMTLHQVLDLAPDFHAHTHTTHTHTPSDRHMPVSAGYVPS